MALEQGRTVYAVPGHPLDPRAEGTNGLIKSGATVVTTAADIVADLAPQLDAPTALDQPGSKPSAGPTGFATAPRPPPLPPPELDAAERRCVFDAIGAAPIGLDELIRATGLPPQAGKIALLEISLAGRLETHGQNLVSLRPTAPDDEIA